MQQHPPIPYAERIADLLSDTTIANAKLALRIAAVLLEGREKAEFSSLLDLEREASLTSGSHKHQQNEQGDPLSRQSL